MDIEREIPSAVVIKGLSDRWIKRIQRDYIDNLDESAIYFCNESCWKDVMIGHGKVLAETYEYICFIDGNDFEYAGRSYVDMESSYMTVMENTVADSKYIRGIVDLFEIFTIDFLMKYPLEKIIE